MITLSYPGFSYPLSFENGRPGVLTVESPLLFREMLTDLDNQANGLSGEFVLSLDGSPIQLTSVLNIIKDPLQPDFTAKKIITYIHKMLASDAVNEKYYISTLNIQNELSKYLFDISDSLDVPLIFNTEPDPVSLFKAVDLRPAAENGSFLENLCSYMALITALNIRALFAFVNLKSYFSEEELRCFYTECKYKKYLVLLLESCDRPGLKDQENTILIDNDLCEVINNNTFF